ncbi:hypothetical protein BIV57_01900 [Mangrovactinospora gilvigrisea]|uniref:DUF2147 domain-containing protein n=1 Tax=Mangrovactinospora gilvigrisea TaxID=1428644 RepID=A0A1J7BKU3_9ACTN|nr:hypothetical protein BIV57_01900 [Mangrovactinospora gilvigrisea]
MAVLAAAGVLLAVVRPSAKPANAVPEAYLGTWNGSVGAEPATRATPATQWTRISLTVKRGKVTAAVGGGNNRRREQGSGRMLGCRYAVRLTKVEPNSLVLKSFNDRPVDGAQSKPGEACPQGMTVTLTRVRPGVLQYDESQSGPAGAPAPAAFNHARIHRTGN